MNYEMRVVIADPNTKEGMISDLMLDMTAEFAYDPEQYGNGYSLVIEGKEGFANHYDLRYDKDFDSRHKIAYLAEWADRYWSGTNGAYKLKSITIKEA